MSSGSLTDIITRAERCHQAGNLVEAAEGYRQALALAPGLSRTAYNLGTIYLADCDYRLAELAFRQALSHEPGLSEAAANLTVCLMEQGHIQEALQTATLLNRDYPDNPTIRFSLAHLQLLTGDFKNGWEGYECRFHTTTPVPERHSDLPLWDGTPRPGLRLLLHAEQGFGDTLQMVRYIPGMAMNGVRVYLECPAPLQSLLERVQGVAGCHARGDALPYCDCQLPLMSLPRVSATTLDTIPAVTPYITADHADIKAWHSRLPHTANLRVGLVWAGRQNLAINRKRSCPPEFIAQLLAVPRTTYISLQTEVPKEYRLSDARLHDPTHDICDFKDTAAIIANLDLVITIDTAVAHLAGAMGKQTWLLLPFVADWRWLAERDDSPWYPTMRLFRQQQLNDWRQPTAQIKKALEMLANTTQMSFLLRSTPFSHNIHLPSMAMSLDNETPAAENRDGRGNESIPEENTREQIVNALYERIRQTLAAGDLNEASQLAAQALLIDDSIPELFNVLGLIRIRQQRYTDAIDALEQALHLEPDLSDALLNLATALHKIGRSEQAITLCRRAIELEPSTARNWQNLGVLLQATGMYAEAETCYRKALHLSPGHTTTHWNLAQLLLQLGRYDEGWPLFEARFDSAEPVPRRYTYLPRWQGEPLTGKRILVHAEQGYGSTIQFSRYLPLLAARGARVLFECQDAHIAPLFASIDGIEQLFTRADQPQSADVQIPLMSIPGLMGTSLDTIPDKTPYLAVPADLRDFWRSLVTSHERLRIGLCWAGRPLPDPRRSCPLRELQPLFSLSNAEFYSLQVDAFDADDAEVLTHAHIIDLTGHIHDFADTAALISHLDLIISIDTVVAHLAGALGKPTWTLLPFMADWRWLTARDDSPWYPSMRLFRQTAVDSWQEPVARITAELTTMLTASPRTADNLTPVARELFETANQFVSQQLFDQAEKIYRKSLLLVGEMDATLKSTIYHNLAVALSSAGRFSEAAAELQAAIRLDDSARNRNSLGAIFQKAGDLDAAELEYRQALERDQTNKFALNNYGVTRQFKGDPRTAREFFHRALAQDPEYADARYNLSLVDLLLGNYREGWANHHARYLKTTAPVEQRNLGLPIWDGRICPEETILIFCEQGYGDTFQFLRFIPEVAARCKRVVVECPHISIRSVITRMQGVAAVIVRGEPLPEDCRWCCSLADLSALLDITLETLPYRSAYITAEETRARFWHEQIAAVSTRKIALVWGGNPLHENDRNRSLPLQALAPLCSLAGCTFFSLQLGPPAAQLAACNLNSRITDLASQIRDFEDTVAILSTMDLLISVDTAVAHLAAAMGRPTWIMLPYSPDWRWLLDRSDSPWYPSVRLFRQPRPSDWDSVVSSLFAALSLLTTEEPINEDEA